MRRSLVALATAALALAGCGVAGNRSATTYRDRDGWRVSYPSDFRIEHSVGVVRITVRETTFANFRSRRGVRTGTTPHGAWLREVPPAETRGLFPPGGVAFRILRREGGPPPGLEAPEARFPLSLADFRRTGSWRGTPQPRELAFAANGLDYGGEIWIGPRAAAADRRELAAVVSSLRFPSLRVGQEVGNGFTVLDRPSRYPLRSVTRIGARGVPFYLVHAPGGFYALGWRWQTISGGYKSRCDVRFDRKRFAFTCAKLGARWDRVGRVLRKPRGFPEDPLNLSIVKPAQDGHLLLAAGTAAFADRRMERKYWP